MQKYEKERKQANYFGFSLAYSYLCTLKSTIKRDNGMSQTTKTIFRLRVSAFLALALMLVSWGQEQGELIPDAPVYSDPSQWYMKDRGKGADFFYIVSTETGDYVKDGDTCHFADTYDRNVCKGILKEMRAADSLFNDGFNYFSPYYRQVTMQSWGDVETTNRRLPVAIGDVKRSWDYYIKYLNNGRPFVIAGFSQGAHAMLEILREMPEEVYRRMVAAYCFGYRIPQEMVDNCPNIRPAEGATDLGAIINFNSVRSPECAIPVVSGGNVVCINPVNWRTDTVAAQFICIRRKQNDTLTARMDPDSHLIIVDGYKDNYVMPVFGRPGNYHHMELRFYYPYIRQNITDRISTYFAIRRRPE